MGRSTPNVFGPPQELPGDQYTDVDLWLLQGYNAYLESLCPECGMPYWYGHSEAGEVNFKVTAAMCHACADMQDELKDKPPKHGAKPLVKLEPIPVEGGDPIPIPTPEEAAARLPRA